MNTLGVITYSDKKGITDRGVFSFEGQTLTKGSVCKLDLFGWLFMFIYNPDKSVSKYPIAMRSINYKGDNFNEVKGIKVYIKVDNVFKLTGIGSILAYQKENGSWYEICSFSFMTS
jgi:hypothetical protein